MFNFFNKLLKIYYQCFLFQDMFIKDSVMFKLDILILGQIIFELELRGLFMIGIRLELNERFIQDDLSINLY